MTLEQAELAYGADDFATALPLYEQLAKAGEPQALYRLGYMYSHAEGVKQDLSRAIAYYHQAAETGHAVAAYCLAAMFAQGRGTPLDYGQAMQWYRRAAEAGNVDAQFKIGCMYARSEGIEKDYGAARAWWLKAAEQGHSAAMLFLGHLYANGDGVEPSPTQAVSWYTRAWEADHDEAEERLLELLPHVKEEAEAGSTDAQYWYGYVQYAGFHDDEEAAYWLTQAAEAKHPAAARLLGYMVEHGEGAPQDVEHAVALYRIGAEGGDALAQHNLAASYAAGDGVEVDIDQAIEWYRRAAENGHFGSQQPLAELLAQRSRNRADACEAVQRLMLVAAAWPDEEFALLGGHNQWAVKISDGGQVVGLMGVTHDQLTMSEEPLSFEPVDQAMLDSLADILHDSDSSTEARNLYQEGCEAMDHGHFEEAIALFTASLELEPDDAAYSNRAFAWTELNELRKAIADYDQAIQLGEDISPYLASRGWCYEQLGEYQKALEDYNRAIEVDPENALAYNNRAWVLATCPDDSLRNGAAAVKDALTSCELNNWEDAGDLDTLAAAYAEYGDFEQAIHWITKAMEAGQDNEGLQKKLDWYRQGKPYRMTTPS